MSKREKILLTLMAAVIVGAGFFLLADKLLVPGTGKSAKASVSVEEVKKQVEDLSARANETALPKGALALVAAAAKPWNNTAMFDGPADFKQEEKDKNKPKLPSYTGFMELGSERLAIVDGFEYMVGDILEGGKRRVVKIEPDQVVLEDLDGAGQVTLKYEDPNVSAR
jgi:hypothetical protein